MSGAAPLEKLAATVGRPLPVDEYDTVAGFVFSLLGQIPDDGQTPILEDCGLRIEVLAIQEHRLEVALVYLL